MNHLAADNHILMINSEVHWHKDVISNQVTMRLNRFVIVFGLQFVIEGLESSKHFCHIVSLEIGALTCSLSCQFFFSKYRSYIECWCDFNFRIQRDTKFYDSFFKNLHSKATCVYVFLTSEYVTDRCLVS